jgi:drug/metabolite transporter (DMT)-like permease
MDFKSEFNLKILLMRNGLISLHSFAFSLCQFYLPLSMAHTINCTGPVFILAEDYIMNGTRINMKQFTGILFALCGVILTINGKVFL